SIFKSSEKERYIITSITLGLTKTPMQPPFYKKKKKYLTKNNVTYYDPKTIRDAVIAIRANRLPNPKIHPNAGSFFKNPIIEKWVLDEAQENHSDMPAYDMGNNKFKVPAGWLIEQVDMKDYTAHNLKTYKNNSLVVVNDNNANYEDLKEFRSEIITAVRDEFRIELQQEPIEL
ncbi:UDP-N-acetylmuramate dehydrogenase, partial [Candidatus Saccharibacteria bacterium]|nr:UDP-N-acetylmuramate dehydrogenase [Candidatus Saccharibacteria bacterium]